jgi:hypothetical protein
MAMPFGTLTADFDPDRRDRIEEKKDAIRAELSDDQIDDLWDEEAGYYNLYEEARRFARRLLSL